jgi:hypothetical protein
MDPDQTAQRLVWIHAGRKPIMLVLSWRGSFVIFWIDSQDDDDDDEDETVKSRMMGAATQAYVCESDVTTGRC